ncbi:hypothetical protein D9M71_808600 [compost metagenome]
MSAGLISSTPIAVPIGIGLGVVSASVIGISVLRMRSLKRKLAAKPDGVELHFSDKEAKLVEKIIKWIGRKLSKYLRTMWPEAAPAERTEK